MARPSRPRSPGRSSSPAKPSGRRHHVAPEIRREQIIQAALGLFARQGFARTTTRDIAAAAGIAEGTIYNHFAGKEDLLLAFVKSAALDPLGGLLPLLENATDEAAVTAIVRDRLQLWKERLPVMKVIFGEALFQPKLARRIRDDLFHPAMRLMSDFFRRRMACGRMRAIDPLLAASSLMGISFFGFMAHHLGSDHFGSERKGRRSFEALAGELAGVFLNGVTGDCLGRKAARATDKRPRPTPPKTGTRAKTWEPGKPGKVGKPAKKGHCRKSAEEACDTTVIAAVADQSEAKQSGRLKQRRQIASSALPPRNDDFTSPSVSNLATVSKKETVGRKPGNPGDAR